MSIMLHPGRSKRLRNTPNGSLIALGLTMHEATSKKNYKEQIAEC